MSLSEDQAEHRRHCAEAEAEDKTEDKEIEEDTPLVATAPEVFLPEEQPSACTDVSASPAFQCLDEVRNMGICYAAIIYEWHFGSVLRKINILFGS